MAESESIQLKREIEERKRAEQITRTLFSISNAVNTASDLDELYASIHQTLGRILNLTNFFIALYYKDTGRVSFPYFTDQFDSAETYSDQFSEDNSLTGTTIRGGKPVFLDKEVLRERAAQNRIIGTTPTVWIGVPLFIKGEVIGIMATQSYDAHHSFSNKDLDLLVSVSDQVALAIERKRNEQALIASEERFRLAMDATSDGLWDWDLKTDRVYYSPGYFVMLGYPPDHPHNTAEFWKEHIHPDDKDKVLEANNRCIETTCNDFEIETRMRTREGCWRWIRGRGMVVNRAQDGRALRLIGTHTDITRQKEMENELRASEIKYRSMMESMIDPVYICSSDLRIHYMNPAMVRRIGRDATGEFCHSALHNLAEKCPWCRLESQDNTFFEMDIVSPKDNRSYHVSSSPITHTNKSVMMLTVLRDTTEMKRIEAQLQQAQKMESIGNLAGGIAHDFNNILTPIIGISEMLMVESQPGSVEYENAYEILKAGQRGSELVKRILAFSRQSDNRKIPVRVQSVVKEVLKLCRSTIPSSIEIVDDIQHDAGLIEADSTQIHQIVMNLITNAFHAVEEKNGSISTSVKEVYIDPEDAVVPLPGPGKYVKLSVSDNGHGMAPDVVERIFDPYFTTKSKGKGTGLGLATVYGIVQNHGGEIRVESFPGKGTSFDIFFPLMKQEKDTVLPEQEAEKVGGTESILLVDDEEAIVYLQKKLLERLGYKVTGKISSAEALKTFRENPDGFDLVISDMTMPGLTGDQLATQLLTVRPNLPIIICTGYSQKINRDNADAIGIKGFLTKPLDFGEMAVLIRRLLKEKDAYSLDSPLP